MNRNALHMANVEVTISQNGFRSISSYHNHVRAINYRGERLETREERVVKVIEGGFGSDLRVTGSSQYRPMLFV